MKTGKQNKITLGIKGDRIGITCFCFFLISGTIHHDVLLQQCCGCTWGLTSQHDTTYM